MTVGYYPKYIKYSRSQPPTNQITQFLKMWYRAKQNSQQRYNSAPMRKTQLCCAHAIGITSLASPICRDSSTVLWDAGPAVSAARKVRIRISSAALMTPLKPTHLPPASIKGQSPATFRSLSAFICPVISSPLFYKFRWEAGLQEITWVRLIPCSQPLTGEWN